MPLARPLRVLALAGATVAVALGAGGAVSAQEDGTTSTTQLDPPSDDGSTTTSTTQLDPPDDGSSTTTTTQLDPPSGDGSTTTTTQLEVGGDVATPGGTTGAVAPPTRIDAGAGGAADGTEAPLAAVLLAGGLAAVTGAGAVQVRRRTRG